MWFVLIIFLCANCSKNSKTLDELVGESQIIGDEPVTDGPAGAVTFNDMLGVNAFEWNFGTQNNPTDPERSQFFQPFAGVRHYLDWRQIEPEKEKYGYNPSARGGWKYDEIYEWCKQQNITVLACIKTIPDWLIDTYPEDKRDAENVPAKYGADLSDPASYLDFGKLAFQYAARYGSNTKVDSSLVRVEPIPHYNPNQKRIGTGLVQYIECNNEPNRWWKPDKVATQTASEYAANLSAFYDGHKGALGPDVGVKTADPNMQVVMGGIAAADPAYVQEMIDWCEKHRGRRADGSVDLCFDIINYHHYSHNRDEVKRRADQRGIAPELSDAADLAQGFVELARTSAYNIPVWNTEVGFDVSQLSVQKAIPIGNKSALMTQADWNLRTALLYARTGVSKLFFYMLHDVDINSTLQYASSGFVDEVGGYSARPSWYYMAQAKNLIGDFYYNQTVNADPIVDEYVLGDKKIYVLVVPDEKGRTADYTLKLGSQVKQVKIHTLLPDQPTAASATKSVNKGEIKLTVSETPMFVEII